MSAERKTRMVALGVVVSGLLGSLIVLISGGQLNAAKEALSISISIVSAIALIKRANWARWLIGIGASLGVLFSLLPIFDRRAFAMLFQSWFGLWFLLVMAFSCWVVYSLFFDRQVVRYFKRGESPEPTKEEAEQAKHGDTSQRPC